jgi:hypothetical protein
MFIKIETLKILSIKFYSVSKCELFALVQPVLGPGVA